MFRRCAGQACRCVQIGAACDFEAKPDECRLIGALGGRQSEIEGKRLHPIKVGHAEMDMVNSGDLRDIAPAAALVDAANDSVEYMSNRSHEPTRIHRNDGNGKGYSA